MAKKSQRRPPRHERSQSGCMWGLISMFDFRNGRPTQKLISDSRRVGKHLAGIGNQKDKVDSLDKTCEGTLDNEEIKTAAAAIGKPSVKKLIAEEMLTEQDPKKDINDAEAEPEQCNSEHEGQKSKNRKRRSRSRTKSCDMHLEDPDIPENLDPEQASLENSEKQSKSNLDIDEIMEELCNQIHQKSISYVRHDLEDEEHYQLNQKNPDFEEKLGEAIKLISEKLINNKYLADGESHPSKEVKDALQILSSDEEYKSIMVKHVQDLWNAQIEKNEDVGSVLGANLSEQGSCDLRQADGVVPCKQRKFFRRKTKAVVNDPSKGNEISQPSSRIVILKPGPKNLQNPETESCPSSSLESQLIASNKGSNDKVSSNFFLTEIKRKFKHAMGKERQEISTNGNSKRFSNKHPAVDDIDKVFKENPGRNSPGKDHFFIEKIARPPIGSKNKEKGTKLKETEGRAQYETINFPRQRLSNIYIEAKKHLSEMLSSGPGDVDFPSGQAPKTLGRILSLPEYNFSPIDSPGRDWEQSFMTARMRLSANDKFQRQENSGHHLDRTTVNLEAQSCVPDDHTDSKVQSPSNNYLNASSDFRDEEGEKPYGLVDDEMTSKGDVKATEIVVHDDKDTLDIFSEPSSPSITIDDQNVDISEVFDEKAHFDCLKDDSHEGNQPPSSPITSPSTSTIEKLCDPEEVAEIPDRPSPVSVLEPIFSEEDVSPASTRSLPVELPVEPLRIQFEEHDLSAADAGIHLKTCMEDKDSIFEYVKAVLQASDMNWDDLYVMAPSSEQLLDPSILVEVEFLPNQLCCEKELLFDCIGEVLMEIYGRYYGCFCGLSFVKSTIQPAPDLKNCLFEVWKGVYWHLVPMPVPHSLDQIVKKDLSKTGMWMDLQFDAESILIEVGEAIFEDLMEEIILGWSNGSSEIGSPLIPADLKETDHDIN